MHLRAVGILGIGRARNSPKAVEGHLTLKASYFLPYAPGGVREQDAGWLYRKNYFAGGAFCTNSFSLTVNASNPKRSELFLPTYRKTSLPKGSRINKAG